MKKEQRKVNKDKDNLQNTNICTRGISEENRERNRKNTWRAKNFPNLMKYMNLCILEVQ
jgi:hypothetical protein